MKSALVIGSALIFFAVLAVPFLGAQEKAGDAAALFEKKCSTCHPSDRAKSKKKDLKDWEATVSRMKEKKNAAISADEAKQITAYLAKTYGK